MLRCRAGSRRRRPHRRPARGPQRAPARGRHPRRRPAAHPGRRRLGQDARAHPPHRLARADRARARRASCWPSPSPTRPRRRCASASSCCSATRRAAMWVMTFHAACARLLRAEAPRLGYTRQYTIYDAADSRRLVKRCIDELGVDPKRFTPAAIQHQISDAKNKLRDAEAYRQQVGSLLRADRRRRLRALRARPAPHERDGLRRPARAAPSTCSSCSPRSAPATPPPSATSSSTSTRTPTTPSTGCCSCWPASTATSRWSGTTISASSRARRSRWPTGRPSRSRTSASATWCSRATAAATCAPRASPTPSRRTARDGIRIRTRGGREIVSTPEHTHFAGFRLGLTPQMHMTYLMRRASRGCRVGVTRTYTDGQVKPVHRAAAALQPRARGRGVGGVGRTRARREARAAEHAAVGAVRAADDPVRRRAGGATAWSAARR